MTDALTRQIQTILAEVPCAEPPSRFNHSSQYTMTLQGGLKQVSNSAAQAVGDALNSMDVQNAENKSKYLRVQVNLSSKEVDQGRFNAGLRVMHIFNCGNENFKCYELVIGYKQWRHRPYCRSFYSARHSDKQVVA